jgi:hypothetical protein
MSQANSSSSVRLSSGLASEPARLSFSLNLTICPSVAFADETLGHEIFHRPADVIDLPCFIFVDDHALGPEMLQRLPSRVRSPGRSQLHLHACHSRNLSPPRKVMQLKQN